MEFKIQKLRIVKSGPIDDIEIDFLNPETKKPLDFVVIGGANGSGKTTILEIIYGLIYTLEGLTDYTLNLFKKTEYAQIDLLVNEIPISIFQGKIPENAIIHENLFGTFSNFYKYEQIGTTIKHLRHSISTHPNKNINLKDSQNENLNKSIPPTLLYFPSYRVLEEVKSKRQIHLEDTKYKLVYKYENIRKFEGSLESYLIWLDYAEKEDFEKIIAFINETAIVGKKIKIIRNKLQIFVETENQEEHPLHELSSGEQNLLILLAELRRRIDRPAIVLIDEIENSLHPEFQLRLIQALKKLQESVSIQFICTTHSKQILDFVDYKSVRNITSF